MDKPADRSTNASIRLLMVEDSPEDAELLLHSLRKNGLEVVSRRVETAAEFKAALEHSEPDLIMSDFTLPTFGGMEALQIAREHRPDTPFLFVSGTLGEEQAIEALKHGAVDYVLKDNAVRLAPAVRRALKEAEDRRGRRNAELDLRESEERFRNAMHFSAIGMALVSPKGQLRTVNPVLCRILGYTQDELLLMDYQSVTYPDDLPKGLNQVRRMLGQEIDHYHAERRYLRKDGRIIWAWVSVSLVWYDSGEPRYFIAQIQDITERKQQEERINRLSRIRDVLSSINATIVRVRDRRELLRDTCRVAVRQGGFKMAWVGLSEPDSNQLKPFVWEGFDAGYLEQVGRALASASENRGIVAQALRDEVVVVVNDLENDPRIVFKQEAVARGYHSLAALPLVANAKAIGILVLYAAEPWFFDSDELKLLKEMAGDISFALDYIANEERLTYLSYYDTLTGLANRHLFFDRLAQALNHEKTERHDIAVLIVELQRFKNINDSLGRSGGDRVLKEFADRLRKTFGEAATPARIGGDRFAVAATGFSGPTLARLIDNWMIPSLVEPFVIDATELRAAIKIGIALYPTDGETAESLFMNAEAALKRAKEGAERYLFYSREMNAQVVKNLHLESRLRKAVAQRQFILHYQPKIDLTTLRICGLEALIRWRDPEQGMVLPQHFVPLLEESGLIVEVGQWVIEQAVVDMRLWRDAGLEVPRVAVNVSQLQLQRTDFVSKVLAATSNAPDGGGVDLEITESLIAQNTEVNVRKLLELRKAGLRVFMDDFGTGYSSLNQIAQMPLDALKIDRSFISGMVSNANHRAIVYTIVSLARALKIRVVAEGVETNDQAALLKSFDCDEAQGYLFSRPMPPEDIAKQLAPAR